MVDWREASPEDLIRMKQEEQDREDWPDPEDVEPPEHPLQHIHDSRIDFMIDPRGGRDDRDY